MQLHVRFVFYNPLKINTLHIKNTLQCPFFFLKNQNRIADFLLYNF
jgi:hypothetical protein